MLKKGVFKVLAAMLIIACNVFSQTNQPRPFNDITAAEWVENIRMGKNLHTLGNYNLFWLDEYPTLEEIQLAWHQPLITKAYIDELKKAGFNAVRMTVNWRCRRTDADGNIRADWMTRVKEIVGYAVDNDMYIYLAFENHSDVANFTDAGKAEWLAVYEKLWVQIADAFKDYDEKLVFEGMNEAHTFVGGFGGTWVCGGYDYGTQERIDCIEEEMRGINEMNQRFVNIVRASGGNNDRRVLIVRALGGSHHHLEYFEIPNDPADNKLIFASQHYVNCIIGTGSSERLRYNIAIPTLDELHERFVKNGIPVVFAEMGPSSAVNLSGTASRGDWQWTYGIPLHTEEAITWAEMFLTHATSLGMRAFWFDEHPRNIFRGDIDGYTQTEYSKNFLPALLRAANPDFKKLYPPIAPRIVDAQPAPWVGSGAVEIAWSPVENADSYNVYRWNNGNYELIGNSTNSIPQNDGSVLYFYIDDNLPTGAAYHYKVSSVNSNGEGTRSLIASAFLGTNPMPPAPRMVWVGDATFWAGDGGNVFIQWAPIRSQHSENISSYNVYRSTNQSSGYELIATSEIWKDPREGIGYGEVFNVLDLERHPVGTTLYYIVTAVNAHGLESAPSFEREITVRGGTPPETPETWWFREENGTVEILFYSVDWAESYDIYRSKLQHGTYEHIGNTAQYILTENGKRYSYMDRELFPGRYFYRVIARNAFGESYQWARGREFTVQGVVPYVHAQAATWIGDRAIQISWNPVSTATSYNVYRSTSANGVFEKIGTSTATAEYNGEIFFYYNDTELPNGTYFYRVRAVNSTGESRQSDVPPGITINVAPPAVPTNLWAVDAAAWGQHGTIHLNWSPAARASSYNIYRSTSANGTFVKIGESTQSRETENGTLYYYDDRGLSAGTYFYRITAVNSAGESAQSGVVSATTAGSGTVSIIDIEKSNNRHGIRFAVNPVSENAEISVILPTASTGSATEVSIVIYDMTGNVVYSGASTGSATGGAIVWDLRNTAGRFVANGTYLVIAEVKDRNGKIYRYSARLGVKR